MSTDNNLSKHLDTIGKSLDERLRKKKRLGDSSEYSKPAKKRALPVSYIGKNCYFIYRRNPYYLFKMDTLKRFIFQNLQNVQLLQRKRSLARPSKIT